MKRCMFLMASAVLLMRMLFAADKALDPVLKGLDPVALGRGEEQKGKPEFETLHEGFRYRFASAGNRQKFLSDPTRFGIQYDGACMRMGPLSGGGSPERWAVHDGRIYLFASEACRSTFLKSPAKYVIGPEAPPTGTPAQAKRAKELLDQALRATADGLAWRTLKGLRIRTRHTTESGGESTSFNRVTTLSLPRLLSVQEEHGEKGEYRGGWELREDGGFITWGPERVVGAQSRAHMLREYHRQPIALLKAWTEGEVSQAFVTGAGEDEGKPFEWVAVHVEGATTRLAIDPASGRIVRVGYSGFGSSGVVPMDFAFGDFRKVKGFTLPFRVTPFAEGVPGEGTKTEVLGIDVE